MEVLESRPSHPIITNWMALIEAVNPIQSLADVLLQNDKLTEAEYTEILQSNDERHNLRLLLFTMQDKDSSVLPEFIQWLYDNGHEDIVNLLKARKTSRCVPFQLANNDTDTNDEKTSSLEAVYDLIPKDNSTNPLDIRVNLSNKFHDTEEYNKNLGYYYSRSKNRGRALIINNFDFADPQHKFRKGASVDQENLEKLFTQMGGWQIESHNNKTVSEMIKIIIDFTKYDKSKICDMCFVFIMSHGTDRSMGTSVFGKDGECIPTEVIQGYFTNEKCRLYRGRPKIFIFQVCRGSDIDIALKHTENDSACTRPTRLEKPIKEIKTLRNIEDVLIGYATLHGSKAHRDPNRGTWYIELICQMFMTFAHDESVDHLLMKVDEGLRNRFSECLTTQTSETHNRGFKKLYLNPGIYERCGELHKYN